MPQSHLLVSECHSTPPECHSHPRWKAISPQLSSQSKIDCWLQQQLINSKTRGKWSCFCCSLDISIYILGWMGWSGLLWNMFCRMSSKYQKQWCSVVTARPCAFRIIASFILTLPSRQEKRVTFFLSSRHKKTKTVWGKTSVSETPLATRSHNDYGCCTKGNLLCESPMSGEIFTGHIKREVKLPKSVLSSRGPLLMTGHWNNPQRTWRNAENAACLLSCEIGGYLKQRFKAWLIYAMPRVISSARHYFWRFYGVSESCTVPTRPRCSCVDWKKNNTEFTDVRLYRRHISQVQCSLATAVQLNNSLQWLKRSKSCKLIRNA